MNEEMPLMCGTWQPFLDIEASSGHLNCIVDDESHGPKTFVMRSSPINLM